MMQPNSQSIEKKANWVKRLAIGLIFLGTILLAQPTHISFAESSNAAAAAGDWTQLGHDAQRTNYTSLQVDPPYCYAWKWYEPPIASRVQPVVANGRLYIGSMDGVMYARDATTGASLWTYVVGGPIRHSAAVFNNVVVFSSYDGYTYGLDATSGAWKWQLFTGSSMTAPLIDPNGRTYVASTGGKLTALDANTGAQYWQIDSGAPILTSPSLSVDNQTVFFGNESIQAIAVRASDGGQVWRVALQGQSLADRYPVVMNDTVLYRSQPLDFFHDLLHDGDSTMDLAGAVNANWATDWANVRPQIVNYLTANASKQTFFALASTTGASRGVAPVLYTYGGNDPPNVPVVNGTNVYVTYRPRHGIQTDSPNDVHVTSKYDAELGQMSISTLDITGIQKASSATFNYQFRLTSDEPANLSMSGNILWSDNWERLGGVNVATGQLIYASNVSNNWPECGSQCGIPGSNPFFPMSGNPVDPAYPFPSPRVTEGNQRAGMVIANNMLYWRVIEGGLGAMTHQTTSPCPAPKIYTSTPVRAAVATKSTTAAPTAQPRVATAGNFKVFLPLIVGGGSPITSGGPHKLSDYLTLDLTAPVSNPPSDLVTRLRSEVQAIVSTNDHLMPLYLQRGFSEPYLWPYESPSSPSLPVVTYNSNGNIYWHNPGDLLYAMAMAYPYLDATLQASVKSYMAAEMNRYPPLQSLGCCSGTGTPAWLKQGVARETYPVPFRNSLNSWPPANASLSTLYGLWLWSKNTGDWSYAQNHWADITAVYNAGSGNAIDYYADISGIMGYARLAQHFGNTTAFNQAQTLAMTALTSGLNLSSRTTYANGQYLDPRGLPTGWSMPALFGLTPEVGLYLREQTNGQAQTYISSLESGNGVRWWYLTRGGVQAEEGETSYMSPDTAWSHFLAHAYVIGDTRSNLIKWLDRPWTKGDLYSIQKIVATIQASP